MQNDLSGRSQVPAGLLAIDDPASITGIEDRLGLGRIMMANRSGRHFLQIPGPTNVPDRVLEAIGQPTIDHRGPRFRHLTAEVLERLAAIFKTEGQVIIYPSSGTGAWEAALVNTLSPGDRLLMYETGHFATLWHALAERLGLAPQLMPGDWRSGVDVAALQDLLEQDTHHDIKAVCIVHNETSTGVTSDIPAVRASIQSASVSSASIRLLKSSLQTSVTGRRARVKRLP